MERYTIVFAMVWFFLSVTRYTPKLYGQIDKEELMDIKLFNAAGDKIFEERIRAQKAGEIRIHPPYLPSGIYWVEIIATERRYKECITIR